MDCVQEIILLFTKYPLAGKSKTRLIPALGCRGAARLQRLMASYITLKLRDFCHQHHCHLEIHYEGGSLQLMQDWLGPKLCYKQQNPDDLGRRMALAIAPHLGEYRSIVVTGSDCPDIDSSIVSASFEALKEFDIVLGPAFDGGYYLIGVQGGLAEQSLHNLFTGIDWGTENVLTQTLSRIQELLLRCHLLKKLHDIDRPEDLRYLNYHSDPQ